jgi:hypothetical protein
MNRLMVVLAICFLTSGCDSSNPSDSAAAPDAQLIKADQEVQLNPSNYGCEYPIVLEAAIDHYQRQEFAAWASTTGGPGCFSSLPTGLRWTVLQVRGSAAQIGFHTTSEYEAGRVDAPDVGQHDYWVPLKFLRPADPPVAQPETPAVASSAIKDTLLKKHRLRK